MEVVVEPAEGLSETSDLGDRIGVALGNKFALRIPVRLTKFSIMDFAIPDQVPVWGGFNCTTSLALKQ